MSEPFQETSDGILLRVQVLPRSSQSGISGFYNGVVKIKLTSPPLDGRANEECREIIAKALRVSKGSVEIIAGQKNRAKTVLLRGVSLKTLVEWLEKDVAFIPSRKQKTN